MKEKICLECGDSENMHIDGMEQCFNGDCGCKEFVEIELDKNGHCTCDECHEYENKHSDRLHAHCQPVTNN